MDKAPFNVGDKVAINQSRDYFSQYIYNIILTVTKVIAIVDAFTADELADMSSTDGWLIECDRMDSNHGSFNHNELIHASMLRYRIEGDLPAVDCTTWLQGSELAHDDETLFLNWRIVNQEGRTMVAFAGGGSRLIANFVCTAMNKDEVFKEKA